MFQALGVPSTDLSELDWVALSFAQTILRPPENERDDDSDSVLLSHWGARTRAEVLDHLVDHAQSAPADLVDASQSSGQLIATALQKNPALMPHGSPLTLPSLVRRVQRGVLQWAFNAWGFNADPGHRGTALYLAPSLLNHSCDPNCAYHTVARGRMLVVARRNIPAGEQLTMSYLRDLAAPRSMRQTRLLRTWLFHCRCQRCAEPLNRSKDRLYEGCCCLACGGTCFAEQSGHWACDGCPDARPDRTRPHPFACRDTPALPLQSVPPCPLHPVALTPSEPPIDACWLPRPLDHRVSLLTNRPADRDEVARARAQLEAEVVRLIDGQAARDGWSSDTRARCMLGIGAPAIPEVAGVLYVPFLVGLLDQARVAFAQERPRPGEAGDDLPVVRWVDGALAQLAEGASSGLEDGPAMPWYPRPLPGAVQTCVLGNSGNEGKE
ncbi:putative SET and MYND domain-containing protein [Paratrimastix pyriformis]|uniref:SET and MYND domain-containing protein n=1 Tax=Paratrimastix pyriformis TaxID=342808 RepID=A0ABQ8UMY6_9EUKA|nr:putative SET and MYND domain-containing protein [Paratrimastix pyriformis]